MMISSPCCKEVGGVQEVNKRFHLDKIIGKIGMGHGGDSRRRYRQQCPSAPYMQQEITVVHNGIISNYRELQQKLAVRGHVFRSETDSEVVTHLEEGYAKGDDMKTVIFRRCERL
jgi:glucosamine--fructose-6-phosphate aminotransferase (isomerizing)